MYNFLQKDMKDVGFYLHTIHHQGPTARQASPPSLPAGRAAPRARRAAAPRGIIGHCRQPCRWVTVVQMEGLGGQVLGAFGKCRAYIDPHVFTLSICLPVARQVTSPTNFMPRYMLSLR